MIKICGPPEVECRELLLEFTQRRHANHVGQGGHGLRSMFTALLPIVI